MTTQILDPVWLSGACFWCSLNLHLFSNKCCKEVLGSYWGVSSWEVWEEGEACSWGQRGAPSWSIADKPQGRKALAPANRWQCVLCGRVGVWQSPSFLCASSIRPSIGGTTCSAPWVPVLVWQGVELLLGYLPEGWDLVLFVGCVFLFVTFSDNIVLVKSRCLWYSKCLYPPPYKCSRSRLL